MNNIRYTSKDFLPLIIIFSIIGAITLGHQLYYGWNVHEGMRIMMASFFLIFGTFKIINLRQFAQAYSMYDFIAARWYSYGYVYPMLELNLGILYLFNMHPLFTNLSTLILMLVSAAGVLNALRKRNVVTCACLGLLFKIPMTYVTLAEDLIMAAMALFTLATMYF